MVAVVRVLAGLVSLAVSIGIIVGKAFRLSHPYLQWQEVIIGFGVFIFAVLLLPSYVGQRQQRGGHQGDAAAASRPSRQRYCSPARCPKRRVGQLIRCSAIVGCSSDAVGSESAE